MSFLMEPEVILRIVGGIHILTCPLTKVEESFSLQATHDIIYHKTELNKVNAIISSS